MLNFSTVRSALCVALLVAIAGFSYALATPTDDTAASGWHAQSRGNPRLPLQFRNPLVPGSTDRDLGDAALGSQIVRHIHARGGFSPYHFSSDHLSSGFAGTTTLGDAMAALPDSAKPSQSSAVVYVTGLLKGQVGGASGTVADGTPLRFDVTVFDSRGSNPNVLTETFRLTLVDSSRFKFAQSSLNSGVAFKPYLDRIQVIGGRGPLNFSASAIAVTTENGTSHFDNLADVGLFLNPRSGVLTGRPLLAGTISISATCTDSTGAQALSRDRTATGQTLSFNVQPNRRVSSQMFATGISIKGSIANAGADSIKFNGLLNLDGTSLAKLQGAEVSLQIGGYDSPTVVLGENGKGATASSATPAMSVSITADGLISIKISRDSFGTLGTIITDEELVQQRTVIPVSLALGNLFQANELLKFKLRARSDKFQLDYKFGPGNLGGGFLITSVTGKDDTGGTGDAWKVAFASLPANSDKLDTATTATVAIGTNFTDSINVKSANGKVASTESRDASGPHIVKFAYDAKGKGSLITGVLPQKSSELDTATDIPTALSAGKKARFPLLLTVNDANSKELFGAEGSRVIVPKGTTWVSKDLNK